MRLIDADALLEELKKTYKYFDLKFYIEEAPTIEPTKNVETVYRGECYVNWVRPKGEWIENFNFLHRAWECSKCGAITSIKTPFCCECGADMKGDQV